MKTLIILIVGLLAVGCEKPVRELTEEENQIIGEYEFKDEDGYTYKYVFLENGVREWYKMCKKAREAKWSIVNKEIHVDDDFGEIYVYRINKDKSITYIATISFGTHRTDLPKEKQITYIKIKVLTLEEKKAQEQKQKTLRDSVVGEYEHKYNLVVLQKLAGDTIKHVFLENGIVESHRNGKKEEEYKWSIENGKIHMYESITKRIVIWRINTDRSITPIAYIDTNRKRKADPIELQPSYKKIK